MNNKPSKEFAFISIPKTGTQTIHTMLGADLKSAVNLVNGGILDNHCPASVMREKYDDFDQRFVFCFVRNPWHRLISWYSGHRKWNISLYMKMSFEEWVLNGCPHHWRNQQSPTPLDQYSFIHDRDGQCLVDKIGRFENYSDDLSDILKTLNLDLTLEHINKSKKKSSHLFTPQMDDIVNTQFKKDIELFNYEIPRELIAQ